MQNQKTLATEIAATNVTFDDYLENYAADYHEWLEGTVYKMSPIHERHDELTRYLATLFMAYFDAKPIGRIRQAPFVMRFKEYNIAREPDIQVILQANYDKLKPTFMDGAADICIEVVSLESIERDHGTKFLEYEMGGVAEYWVVDPIHDESRFFRLNADRKYVAQREDQDGNYQTPRLPGFTLHVPTLWTDPLPGFSAIAEAVKAMLS